MGGIDDIYDKVDIKALEQIIRGDNQTKNRYLIDIVDNIFNQEIEIENTNIQKIQKQIHLWAKNNEVPPNVMATFIRLDKEEKAQKEKQEYMDSYTESNKEESDAQRLCREYKINIKQLLKEDKKSIKK